MLNTVLNASMPFGIEWGAVIWSSVAFLIVFFLLSKMAWKPILNGLKEREQSIEDALNEAEKARQAMADLKSQNEDLMKTARDERDVILKEAKEVKDKTIAAAKVEAGEVKDKMIADARAAIQNDKAAAMAEIKNHVAALSLNIAEKLVHSKLSDDAGQKALLDTLLADHKLN